MAQKKTVFTKSEVNKKIKSRLVEKRNITFSLPVGLLDKFREATENNDLSMNDVIEELIMRYLGISK